MAFSVRRHRARRWLNRGLVLLSLVLLFKLSACGEDDLVFPGDIPLPPPTSEPTNTPEPTATEEAF